MSSVYGDHMVIELLTWTTRKQTLWVSCPQRMIPMSFSGASMLVCLAVPTGSVQWILSEICCQASGKTFVLDKKNKPKEEESPNYIPLIVLFPLMDAIPKVLAHIVFSELTCEDEKHACCGWQSRKAECWASLISCPRPRNVCFRSSHCVG